MLIKLCTSLFFISSDTSAYNCFSYFEPNIVNLMYISAKDHRNNKLELSNFIGETIFSSFFTKMSTLYIFIISFLIYF